MRARKLVITLAIIALFLGGVGISYAVIPQPFLLKAKLTVNGTPLSGTDPTYSIRVTNTSGTQYTPVDTAGDTFGEAIAGRFSYNIPMYDATDQPNGAQTGATACVQILKDGSPLNMSYPAQGSCPSGYGAITIGSPGESIGFGISATYYFATNITVMTPANITINPTSKDYGGVAVNGSSAQTFTITNAGGETLTFGTPSFSGTNANQFAVSNTTCSSTLAGGASCTVQVTFSPTSSGAKSATLNIPSDAPNNTNLEVSLTGTGIEANIGVSPTSKDYGAVNLGATSSQTFTVTNSGTAVLTVGSVVVTGTNDMEFIKQADTCSGQSVAPLGGTCTIQVVFTPTSAGSKTASLTIPSNDPDTPTLNVSLTGMVNPQNVSPSPTSKDFGSVEAGTSSAAQTFTITNTGNAPLVMGTPSLSGANANQFSITSNACDGATVNPGATCTVEITFSPTSYGPKAAVLVLPSNDPDGAAQVALTGTGLDCEITVSPATLAFGNVVVGYTKDLNITVTNDGNDDLTISSVAIAGAGFSKTADTCDGQTIVGGGTCSITVRLSSSAVTS